MKKISLLLLFCVFNFTQGKAIDTSVYDRLFESLASPRQGLTNEEINGLKNPFPSTKESGQVSNEEKNKVAYIVSGIFGDRVKINQTWYKVGDFIDIYKIKDIQDKVVTLSNDTEEIKLKLRQGNKNVIITYK